MSDLTLPLNSPMINEATDLYGNTHDYIKPSKVEVIIQTIAEGFDVSMTTLIPIIVEETFTLSELGGMSLEQQEYLLINMQNQALAKYEANPDMIALSDIYISVSTSIDQTDEYIEYPNDHKGYEFIPKLKALENIG